MAITKYDEGGDHVREKARACLPPAVFRSCSRPLSCTFTIERMSPSHTPRTMPSPPLDDNKRSPPPTPPSPSNDDASFGAFGYRATPHQRPFPRLSPAHTHTEAKVSRKREREVSQEPSTPRPDDTVRADDFICSCPPGTHDVTPLTYSHRDLARRAPRRAPPALPPVC